MKWSFAATLFAALTTALGGCHLLFPFEAATSVDSGADAGADAKTDGISSSEGHADDWRADKGKPDMLADRGPDAFKSDGPKPDVLKTDGPKTDSKKPDDFKADSLKPDTTCPAKVLSGLMDCSLHPQCQLNNSYWLKWYWSGANTYTVTIDSYTNMYITNIGYFGSTPGTTSVSGSLTASPQQVYYNMPTNIYDVGKIATVTFKITVTNTAMGCSDNAFVTATYNPKL